MSILDRIRSWWNRDDLERAEEETQMATHERDVAEEDFQARKDDVAVRERLLQDGTDFERDSKTPRP